MNKVAPPSRTAPQFVVRLPDDQFRDHIAEAAKANNRSMNAEIVARLQASFDPAPSADGAAAQELADSRAQTIKSMAHLQRSLCESVLRLFATLPAKAQADRGFREVVGMAEGLLDGTEASDFLLGKTDLMEVNPGLAQFLEATAVEAERARMDTRVRVASQRPRRSNAVKR